MDGPRPTKTAYNGYSLIEILAVLAIISLLMALIGGAYYKHLINAKRAASLELLLRIKRAVENYQTSTNRMPIVPGGNLDEESGAPGYYRTKCVAVGQVSDGSESNQDFVAFLKEQGVKFETKYLRDGELVDAFGNPVVFRFLRKLRDPRDPDGPVESRIYLWTYGPDRKNDVNAAPDYANPGRPGLDADEIERMLESKGDDVRSWGGV
jgi:prepilin-type N-terminal cleavage/methylation domain-containing protein